MLMELITTRNKLKTNLFDLLINKKTEVEKAFSLP